MITAFQGGVIFYHTPDDAINMLILIGVGFLIWLAISVFSQGPDGEGPHPVPMPPLADELMGCNPMVWFIVFILIIGFLCWYPNTRIN